MVWEIYQHYLFTCIKRLDCEEEFDELKEKCCVVAEDDIDRVGTWNCSEGVNLYI